ncbi:hypothetical protein EUGRSUZ_A00156 [Eucalyptus grandis]|uniref:Bet v I/Major latex protein domain-containing protein n=2 Tax=Eucalyptus grandis TaxID=71139 RepID=A0A059DBJ3_EUCGR|nr:hypothetical protein EUGRSUZ_A00156 [Eucalyptus grandis]
MHSIPPARMFKAFVLDDNLIPKLLPQAIEDFVTLEGDGGPGTITSFSAKAIFCVTHTYAIVEGDALEKISNEIKAEAGPDREENKASKDKAVGMLKAIEAHLLQKP